MFPRAVNVMTIERVDIPHGIELAHCRRFDAKTTSSAKRFFAVVAGTCSDSRTVIVGLKQVTSISDAAFGAVDSTRRSASRIAEKESENYLKSPTRSVIFVAKDSWMETFFLSRALGCPKFPRDHRHSMPQGVCANRINHCLNRGAARRRTAPQPGALSPRVIHTARLVPANTSRVNSTS